MTAELEAKLAAVLERQAAVLEKIEERLAEGERRLLTIEQACTRIGCKRRKLFRLIHEGKLRKVREGVNTCVTVESVDAYLGVPSRSR